MTISSGCISSTFLKSSLIGAFCGVTLQILIAAWGEPFDPSELWAIPLLVLVYGLLALPFVATGLAVFGLPATRILRRNAQEWWVFQFAVLWGAAAGKLMFFIIDHVLFLGLYDLGKISLNDPGVIYGVPTGIAWWILHRRQIANL